MNKEKLLRMADYVETISEKDFNIEIFFRYEDEKGRTTHGEKTPGCKTIGCAIGWAAYDGVFSELKLRKTLCGDFYISYKNYHGFNAIVELFDISYGKANELFNSYSYKRRNIKPVHVSQKIREFVADDSKW